MGDTTELPYDVSIEQALLGAVLIDNYHLERVSQSLRAEYFYDPLHQRMYTAIDAMNARGHAVTPLTLRGALEHDEGFIEVGGQDYLVSLAKSAPAMPNVRDYVRILTDLAMRRELIRIAIDIANTAYDATPEVTPVNQIEAAEKALYNISEKGRYAEASDFSFGASLTEALKRTEKAINGESAGLLTGLPSMDKMLGGLHASDLVIIAGRPGMGKTALAADIALRVVKAGVPTLFYSLEMASSQLSTRALSQHAKIDAWSIRNGRLNDAEWDALVRASEELQMMPLIIDDTGGIDISRLVARARRAKRSQRIGLVVLDYIQLVSPSKRAGNRVAEITEITAALKNMAKELEIPVVALSQLSRGVDNREDKRPVLSDLRESGSIEQDADIVMFVYREEYYLKSREPDPGTNEHLKWLEKIELCHGKAEILVEKHRHGPTGKLSVRFDDRFTHFWE